MIDYSERRPIEGFSNYEVDGYGNVYSLDRATVARRCNYTYTRHGKGGKLKSALNTHGYPVVTIMSDDGRHLTREIHRLVAKAFIPNPSGLPIVNHKDENKQNNFAENLEWCTYSYNLTYGSKQAVLDTQRKALYGRKITETEWVKYPSIMTAARETGISASNISLVCNQKRKRTKGHVFKFVNPDDVV